MGQGHDPWGCQMDQGHTTGMSPSGEASQQSPEGSYLSPNITGSYLSPNIMGSLRHWVQASWNHCRQR